MKRKLLIIDPQVDFCEGGALPVTGATADMQRLAKMVTRQKDTIDEIGVTLDWHSWDHIAHPVRWRGRDGRHPNPYTTITLEEVVGENPAWKAHDPEHRESQIEYVAALKENGRNTLMIWPPHCIGGTIGATIQPTLVQGLRQYVEHTGKNVRYFLKGQNKETENYSAVRADVILPWDASTDYNLSLLGNMFIDNDLLLVAGEAGSHCVAQTITDAIERLGDNFARKIVLLIDCMSPVTGCENIQKDFFNRMLAKGAVLARSTDL